MTSFGAHQGHAVHPHDHTGQDGHRAGVNWCTGRWLCVTCASGDVPRGLWFTGPVCPKPAPKAKEVAR